MMIEPSGVNPIRANKPAFAHRISIAIKVIDAIPDAKRFNLTIELNRQFRTFPL